MSKSEAIGKMDKRITFQRPVFGSDASNQRKITGWENVPSNPTVWANVNERSGTEVYQADQLTGVTVAEITIRWRNDLAITYRAVYNSKNYDIQAIIESGRKKFMKLTCESGGQYTG
jgi:SPP1 family predicted phage head-tail adaptor